MDHARRLVRSAARATGIGALALVSIAAAACSGGDPRPGGAGTPPNGRGTDPSVRHHDPARPADPRVPGDGRTGGGALTRFGSAAELDAWLARVSSSMVALQRQQNRQRRSATSPAPAQAAEAAAEGPGSAAGDGESITNTQEQGVDEGGIVKTHGDHLVVLRRGRLFSIDLSGGQRRAVSRVDIPAAGQTDAYGAWYDEMLIHGDTIVVVGYSYQSGGTELVLFHIDRDAVITPRGRFHLRSNDYYSSRNYASRLIGRKLIFYMPYAMLRHEWDAANRVPRYTASFPALRVAGSAQPREEDWREIAIATDIYRPVQAATMPVLHTVVTCDLAAPSLDCSARGIIGPYGRTFYVSGDAVYVWTHEAISPWSILDEHGEPRVFPEDADEDDEVAGDVDTAPATTPASPGLPPAMVYRLPLDGSTPGALRVSGAPIDQLSFQQAAGELRVLVRAEGAGDWMWAPEGTAGAVAVVRLPLAWFAGGVETVPGSAYTPLPEVRGWSVQNRWVGDHVFYGSGGGWYAPGEGAERRVYVHRAGASSTSKLELPHGVDRIEVMGDAGVVIGSDGRDLHFTSVALDAGPRVVDRFVQANAAQGETRTHGFFFKPMGEDGGVLGLPVRSGGSHGWRQLVEGSAEVLFLDVRAERFARIGALSARPGVGANDQCRASCVDWYGNARPIFYRGRVFALMGYELVEGRIGGGGIVETGRTTFLSPG